MNYNPGHDFEISLSYGQQGERWIESLIREGNNVEVKRDRKAIRTRNIVIDLGTLYHPKADAEWWVQILETRDDKVAPSGCFIIPVKRLKEVAESFDDLERLGGITHASNGRRLLVIPITDPYWISRLMFP